MEEIWKSVVGFEARYEVSNMGRIRSLPHETLIERKKGKSYILDTSIHHKREQGHKCRVACRLFGRLRPDWHFAAFAVPVKDERCAKNRNIFGWQFRRGKYL